MRPMVSKINTPDSSTGRSTNLSRRDWSNVKCYSCGGLGHTRVRWSYKPPEFVTYMALSSDFQGSH